MTADDVVETERGMMWRVYSSKTEEDAEDPGAVARWPN